jgi:hypothetical protein
MYRRTCTRAVEGADLGTAAAGRATGARTAQPATYPPIDTHSMALQPVPSANQALATGAACTGPEPSTTTSLQQCRMHTCVQACPTLLDGGVGTALLQGCSELTRMKHPPQWQACVRACVCVCVQGGNTGQQEAGHGGACTTVGMCSWLALPTQQNDRATPASAHQECKG